MQRASLVSFAFPVQMSTKDRIASLSICGRDQNTGIVPATVGNAAVILGLDAAGVIGQLGITIAKSTK